MSLPAPLQNFWNDQQSIIQKLYSADEISLAIAAQNIFAKSLILTSASYFENEIKNLVHDALAERAGHDDCVLSFCRKRGIERQFHTWFDWERTNANSFFAMFGDEIKIRSKDLIKSEITFEKSIKDYLFIGQKRNELVHQNFLTYPFEETAEQTHDRIQSAMIFIDKCKYLLCRKRNDI